MVNILVLAFNFSAKGQPDYSPVELLTEFDTSGINSYFTNSNYGEIEFKIQTLEIHDSDNSNITPIKFKGNFLTAFAVSNSKNDSVKIVDCFTFSKDKNKRFLISKQSFLDSIPNGKFEVFNLKGIRIGETNFEMGKQRGISRFYGVKGKEIIEEVEYINDTKVIQREYYFNGKVKQEFPLEDNILNGIGRRFYETGVIMEEVEFSNGEFNGSYKYFHPNNQLWVHIKYKLGKPFNAVENFDENGKKREPGTLKNGTGTLIYYSETGTINETQYFENGIRIK